MPNWCNNTVEIYHKDPAMLERVRKAFDEGALLQEFIPVPQELKDATANFEVNEALVEKYGYSNWYDYSVNEWGTKWDVGADGQPAQDIEGGLILSFDSAWAPPTAAYEKLVEMGFSIRAMYYEPGMCFAGIWENGNDDYYEYSNMSSDEVAETLPVELDEAYCISESMAEWEAENAEEE
jgi:hypothetical protein